MPIASALAVFRSNVTALNGYITRAFTQNVAGTYFLDASERAFVVESAFLRIFIAWESFLEEALIMYLLGHPSAAGRAAWRLASPPDEAHARSMLIGTQKYVDWANPEIVKKISELFFRNGEPIRPAINAIQSDLFDLKTVRNALAHLSSTTSRALDSLATRRLGISVSNILPIDFLLSNDPAAAAPTTILSSYVSLLDATANNIACWR